MSVTHTVETAPCKSKNKERFESRVDPFSPQVGNQTFYYIEKGMFHFTGKKVKVKFCALKKNNSQKANFRVRIMSPSCLTKCYYHATPETPYE